MKISKINSNNLRNDAHFQFHTEFRDLAAKETPEKLKIKPQFTAYLPLYDRVDEALKKINKSEFTAKIHEADKASDEIYIVERVNALIIVEGAENYEQFAKTLNVVIAKYAVRKHHHHRHDAPDSPINPISNNNKENQQ